MELRQRLFTINSRPLYNMRYIMQLYCYMGLKSRYDLGTVEQHTGYLCNSGSLCASLGNRCGFGLSGSWFGCGGIFGVLRGFIVTGLERIKIVTRK